MRYLFYTCVVFLSFLIFFSCRDENSSVGGKWVESAFTNIYTDTCTVKLSTILLDSIATSGDSIAQIGYYADSLRGELTCSYYLEYKLPSFSFSEDVSYEFDSLTIEFVPSGDYLGDTLTYPQRIHIHNLTNALDLQKGYLYNTSTVAYDPDPLVSFNYRFYPKLREKVSVRLPDELGEEFFRLMRQGSIIFSSEAYFRDYFHGFAFVGEEANNCINGFEVSDSTLCIKLHYQQLAASSTERTITFYPNISNSFNKIVHNRGNTLFESLKSNTANAIPSEDTGHMAYMQALSGMYVNLEFPYLNELRKQGEIVSIESAILQLYPVRDSYDKYTPLPNRLSLYTTNDEYVAEDVITDALGSNVQDGSLTIDELYDRETYYYFDITSFLQENLGTTGNSRKKLMLMMPDSDFLNTVNGVFFGDKEHPKSKVKLYVLYQIYN